MMKFEYVVIGTHASYSGSNGGTSCIAIRVHNKNIYLLDCGFGALRGLMEKKLNIDRVKGILVTHNHLDHIGGIPELLWYFENRGVKSKIKIVSPEPIPYEDLEQVNNILPDLITTIPLQHRIPCQGYRVGDDFAYISDTVFLPEIIDKIKGVKTLYHEATYDESKIDRAKLWKHSTGKDAARIALKAEVEKLLLGHISHSVNSQVVLREAKEIFENTYLV